MNKMYCALVRAKMSPLRSGCDVAALPVITVHAWSMLRDNKVVCRFTRTDGRPALRQTLRSSLHTSPPKLSVLISVIAHYICHQS